MLGTEPGSGDKGAQDTEAFKAFPVSALPLGKKAGTFPVNPVATLVSLKQAM